LALQLFFVLRIAALAWWDPASTSFQRSEAVRILRQKNSLPWRQQWQPYDRISVHLKRAVVVSEDDIFAQHDGVQWDAIEKAWTQNNRAQQKAAQAPASRSSAPKIVGGSTITQQLAKNLFLSGERTLLRKGQEMVLALTLEALLSKERILEIYLNSVEWGEGVFGAEAAARHYFRKPASRLSAYEAARLAVTDNGARTTGARLTGGRAWALSWRASTAGSRAAAENHISTARPKAALAVAVAIRRPARQQRPPWSDAIAGTLSAGPRACAISRAVTES
jgi:monofunctional biosynthetic peptidoglycan transglycosylase